MSQRPYLLAHCSLQQTHLRSGCSPLATLTNMYASTLSDGLKAGPGPSSLRASTSLRGCLPFRRSVATHVAQMPPVAKDPFEEKTVYRDSALERVAITLLTNRLADQLAPNKPHVPRHAQYDDFVRVAREILKGRTTTEQHALVKRALLSVMPRPVLSVLRTLARITPQAAVAELNAFFAALGFGWLVGECEVHLTDQKEHTGLASQQYGTVLIKKCRYLESSGCVGACVNLCKVPTQDFFTNDIGLPVTMKPNFEDLSCEMIFGAAPPPLALDPVYTQPCFAVNCSLADKLQTPCPKLDTEKGKAGSSKASLASKNESGGSSASVSDAEKGSA